VANNEHDNNENENDDEEQEMFGRRTGVGQQIEEQENVRRRKRTTSTIDEDKQSDEGAPQDAAAATHAHIVRDREIAHRNVSFNDAMDNPHDGKSYSPARQMVQHGTMLEAGPDIRFTCIDTNVGQSRA
jgi:hypothetical protein